MDLLMLYEGSVFYNLKDNTSSFYSRSVLLFFAILLNAFASALEVPNLPSLNDITESLNFDHRSSFSMPNDLLWKSMPDMPCITHLPRPSHQRYATCRTKFATAFHSILSCIS